MSKAEKSDAAAALQSRATELLAALVAFDSVSSRSNLPLMAFIINYLEDHDVECQLLPSEDGNKGNLIARIGPAVEGGIVLSGHSDVVPVEGQAWESDPFTLTEKDGKLFARGASDMKSFLAICLAFVPEFTKLALKIPIYLAFSYDEEVGCLGVPHLLKHIGKYVPKPSLAIIGEPTMMQVVTAHKGVLSYETTVHGLEWHSSQPHYGVNAVQIACDLVQYLAQMARDCARLGTQDARFDPPYTTVHVGIIRGGTARNIIPKECRFNWEIRPLPGDDADKLFARFDAYCKEQATQMKKNYPEAAIVTKPVSRMLAVTLPAGAEQNAQVVMRCARTNQQQAVSFGTEAGVFNEHGIPAIVCGPGNIEQAHKPNEFIDIAQLRAGVEFMQLLMKEVA